MGPAFTIDTATYLEKEGTFTPFFHQIREYLCTYYGREYDGFMGDIMVELWEAFDRERGCLFFGPMVKGPLLVRLGHRICPPLMHGASYFKQIESLLMARTGGVQEIVDILLRRITHLMVHGKFDFGDAPLMRAVMKQLPINVCQIPGCARPFFRALRPVEYLVHVEAEAYHLLVNVRHLFDTNWQCTLSGIGFIIDDPDLNVIKRTADGLQLTLLAFPGITKDTPCFDACAHCLETRPSKVEILY